MRCFFGVANSLRMIPCYFHVIETYCEYLHMLSEHTDGRTHGEMRKDMNLHGRKK